MRRVSHVPNFSTCQKFYNFQNHARAENFSRTKSSQLRKVSHIPNFASTRNFSPSKCLNMQKILQLTNPRKLKQPFQFWPSFWMVFVGTPTSEPFLNGLCRKSYQTTQIEATFSILTLFRMAFVRNLTRPRKSKQPFQVWPFLNGFCKKLYSMLTLFLKVFAGNPIRPRKWKQPFEV